MGLRTHRGSLCLTFLSYFATLRWQGSPSMAGYPYNVTIPLGDVKVQVAIAGTDTVAAVEISLCV